MHFLCISLYLFSNFTSPSSGLYMHIHVQHSCACLWTTRGQRIIVLIVVYIWQKNGKNCIIACAGYPFSSLHMYIDTGIHIILIQIHTFVEKQQKLLLWHKCKCVSTIISNTDSIIFKKFSVA